VIVLIDLYLELDRRDLPAYAVMMAEHDCCGEETSVDGVFEDAAGHRGYRRGGIANLLDVSQKEVRRARRSDSANQIA
jgi:hypothetical protein